MEHQFLLVFSEFSIRNREQVIKMVTLSLRAISFLMYILLLLCYTFKGTCYTEKKITHNKYLYSANLYEISLYHYNGPVVS